MESVNNYTIRSAKLGDVPFISRIYNECIDSLATYDLEPEKESTRLRWLLEIEKLGYPVVVVEDSLSEIAGWGAITPFHVRPGFRYTVENAVYVKDNHRGNGVGNLILQSLIDQSSLMNFHSIIAKIDSTNTSSIKLHEKFGFQQTGVLKEAGFKHDKWLDVIILQLFLNK